MKRFGLRFLVASSLLLVTTAALAATRPLYGGTLRLATHISPNSLDPLDDAQPESPARRSLTQLLFDTLVVLDDLGRTSPGLATSWQPESDNQTWRFVIRTGVTFDDAAPLTPTMVAAALRAANANLKVYSDANSVFIVSSAPDPTLPASLAQPHNAIIRRTADGLHGTGPFHISEWHPGKRLVAVANEMYWNGRPFLDSVQLDFGINYRDQQVALDLNKADIIEIPPEQAKKATTEGRRIVTSPPSELLALLFVYDRQSEKDEKLRHALALSIDRNSIGNVILQGAGRPSGGILPDWMSGYEFLFPAEVSMDKAREQRIEVAQAPVWTMAFDASDPLSRLVAERVWLNARDAGIPMQTASAGKVDFRLFRLPIPSLETHTALRGICAALRLEAATFANSSVEALYQAENAILQKQRIIPLFHLSVSYGIKARVKNWDMRRDGTWVLADTWLAAEKP